MNDDLATGSATRDARARGSSRPAALACALSFAFGAGCRGPDAEIDVPEGLVESMPVSHGHIGPAVAPPGPDDAGPSRYVAALAAQLDVERAMALATFIDGFYREPASDGYERVADRLLAEFYAAGFGSDPGFDLEVLRTGMPSPSWTPISALLEIVRVNEAGEPIQAITASSFDGPAARSRTMLPSNAPSCEVVGRIADGIDALTEPGMVLLTDQRIRAVEARAKELGAAAIVSRFLYPYCVDPTGEGRHEDAIFHDSVRPGTELPSFYVSPRVARTLVQSEKVGGRVRLQASASLAVRPLRTLVVTIEGDERADEVVHVVAAIDGTGANDNASGAAAIVEGALTLKRLIDGGSLPRPRRSVSFVFGQEAQSGRLALEHETRTVLAALVGDMLGASAARTGATCLLERGFDPGALEPLPPDVHTPWGAGPVAEDDIVPNGLAVVVREALVDVAAASADADPAAAGAAAQWVTREHPWEGGSDHDAYLTRGIAACLVWHFTDFAFATSLDRMDHVDAAELRRSTLAVLAGALAVADARPGDLARHLASLNIERQLRLDAVVRADAGEASLARWKAWFDGARLWLQAVALGSPLPGAD